MPFLGVAFVVMREAWEVVYVLVVYPFKLCMGTLLPPTTAERESLLARFRHQKLDDMSKAMF